MHIGQLLFLTHGELSKKAWWIAQIVIWLLSVATFAIDRKFGLHDAILTSVIWLLFFWWKTNVNIKRLSHRGHRGWSIFWHLLFFEIPVIGWVSGFIVMGCLGKKREKTASKSST